MGKAKGTTKSQGAKDSLDRFYTDESEALRLLSVLVDGHLSPLGMSSKNTVFIEPSAGSGAFVSAAEQLGYACFAYDLRPSPEPVCDTPIIQQDFMSEDFVLSIPERLKEQGIVHLVVIGNPPFGTNGVLAFRFVKKAMLYADMVAMIMPPSACKESSKAKTGTARMRVFYDVEMDDYTLPDGNRVEVPSKFVIYTKKTNDDDVADKKRREQDKKDLESLPFKFTSKKETIEAHASGKTTFSIRRVGGCAGEVRRDIDVSEQSNYFCILKDGENLFDVEDVLREPIPERNYSVGPRSLSKTEIVRAYIKRTANKCE